MTRPRRFGKTIMANMLASYFSKGFDSRDIFDNLEISKSPNYHEHLNKHNVIYIDFSILPLKCNSYENYIDYVVNNLMNDLIQQYPNVNIKLEDGPWLALNKIYSKTHEKFIFIMDEWDSMFYNSVFTKQDQKSFLLFLKSLLKSRAYVEFAYMTGILPIAKHSTGSDLNMFREYNMATSSKYSEYFGFTEKEVQYLYDKYKKITPNPAITYEDLQLWYNGYKTANGIRIYNPRSVVFALEDNSLQSYWTSSGPYDEIFTYIKHNIADVREDIVRMVAGEEVSSKIENYAAVSMDISTKREIFSAMVVYGFLTYYQGKVSIPNKELMMKFEDVLEKKELGYVSKLALKSEEMLNATLRGDTETMEEILSFAHDTEVPILNYNNESDLAALVNLIYVSARDSYRVYREEKAGRGFADVILCPINPSDDCIIIELKVDDTPENAIKQIKDKKYALKFEGSLGDDKKYTGRILAVGMSYDKKSKEHRCAVEVLRG
jgi:hypothetical protein